MERLFPLCLLLTLLVTPGSAVEPPISPAPAPEAATDPSPRVLDGIKYTEIERQGALTRQTCRRLGIPTVPIAYHGGVDTNADGVISENNIARFTEWVDRTIPRERTMPAVLDYEQPWWDELTAESIEPDRLREILDVYLEGLVVAEQLRPDVDWGYWGLPAMRHTSEKWRAQGLSLDALLSRQGAVYPAAYDCNPGSGSDEFGRYATRALESCGGRLPVWVFINTRYCGQRGDRSRFIPVDEVLANAQAILTAEWTDPSGGVHRVAGIVVWDTYGWSDEESWGELDRHNADLFSRLHALAEALPSNGSAAHSPPESPPESP